MATGNVWAKTSGDTIWTADYNGIQAIIGSITGAGLGGDKGYGVVPYSSQVSQYSKVTESQWDNLRLDIDAARTHQTGSASGITNVTDTTKITAADVSAYKTAADAAVTNRLSVAAGQTALVTGISSTYATAWNSFITHITNVNFVSTDDTRYFFNAGGNIRVTASSTGGNPVANSKDLDWSNLITGLGAIYYTPANYRTGGNVVIKGPVYGAGKYATNYYQAWGELIGGSQVRISVIFNDASVQSGAGGAGYDEMVGLSITSAVGYYKSVNGITTLGPPSVVQSKALNSAGAPAVASSYSMDWVPNSGPWQANANLSVTINTVNSTDLTFVVAFISTVTGVDSSSNYGTGLLIPAGQTTVIGYGTRGPQALSGGTYTTNLTNQNGLTYTGGQKIFTMGNPPYPTNYSVAFSPTTGVYQSSTTITATLNAPAITTTTFSITFTSSIGGISAGSYNFSFAQGVSTSSVNQSGAAATGGGTITTTATNIAASSPSIPLGLTFTGGQKTFTMTGNPPSTYTLTWVPTSGGYQSSPTLRVTTNRPAVTDISLTINYTSAISGVSGGSVNFVVTSGTSQANQSIDGTGATSGGTLVATATSQSGLTVSGSATRTYTMAAPPTQFSLAWSPTSGAFGTGSVLTATLDAQAVNSTSLSIPLTSTISGVSSVTATIVIGAGSTSGTYTLSGSGASGGTGGTVTTAATSQTAGGFALTFAGGQKTFTMSAVNEVFQAQAQGGTAAQNINITVSQQLRYTVTGGVPNTTFTWSVAGNQPYQSGRIWPDGTTGPGGVTILNSGTLSLDASGNYDSGYDAFWIAAGTYTETLVFAATGHTRTSTVTTYVPNVATGVNNGDVGGTGITQNSTSIVQAWRQVVLTNSNTGYPFNISYSLSVTPPSASPFGKTGTLGGGASVTQYLPRGHGRTISWTVTAQYCASTTVATSVLAEVNYDSVDAIAEYGFTQAQINTAATGTNCLYNLYISRGLFTGTTGSYYGLFRAPDAGGAAYWINTWISTDGSYSTGNGNFNDLVNSFFSAAKGSVATDSRTGLPPGDGRPSVFDVGGPGGSTITGGSGAGDGYSLYYDRGRV